MADKREQALEFIRKYSVDGTPITDELINLALKNIENKHKKDAERLFDDFLKAAYKANGF